MLDLGHRLRAGCRAPAATSRCAPTCGGCGAATRRKGISEGDEAMIARTCGGRCESGSEDMMAVVAVVGVRGGRAD